MTLNPNLGTHIHASYSPKQEILNLLLTTPYVATLKKELTVSLPWSLEDSHQLRAPGARLKTLSKCPASRTWATTLPSLAETC